VYHTGGRVVERVMPLFQTFSAPDGINFLKIFYPSVDKYNGKAKTHGRGHFSRMKTWNPEKNHPISVPADFSGWKRVLNGSTLGIFGGVSKTGISSGMALQRKSSTI
jgi:hypothetical protein